MGRVDSLSGLVLPACMYQVIVTVFAGRKQSIALMIKYLVVLVQRKLVHEVHLWDFRRHYRLREDFMPAELPWLKRIDPSEEPEHRSKLQWYEYYMHYSREQERYNYSIIIK